jgi:hypothetical protein
MGISRPEIGGKVLAIAHIGDMSNGLVFLVVNRREGWQLRTAHPCRSGRDTAP